MAIKLHILKKITHLKEEHQHAKYQPPQKNKQTKRIVTSFRTKLDCYKINIF